MPGATVVADGRLGQWSTTALVVGHTIGVGVFLTPAALIQGLASPALTVGVWMVSGALVFAGALAFGELASRFPGAGGPYVYLREAWGEQAAFLYGWQCLLVMDPGVTAALASGLSQYAAAAWPSASGSHWIAIGTIWALALINMGGLRLSARILTALAGLKVVALGVVVLLALVAGHGSWSHLTPFVSRPPSARPLTEALALGLVAAFFSFGGFWEASRVAGEVRDANRTLPRALAFGVAMVTAVYLIITLTFLYLVPTGETSSPAEFTRRAGVAMAGPGGPQLLAIVVLASVMASLAALLMMAPRLYVAMSRDAVLPRRLAPLDPSRDSSNLATALLAALATLYALMGSFEQIVSFFFCAALGFVALAVAGLFVLRKRPGAGRATAFRCPGYPLVPASFVLLIAAVVATVAVARPLQAFSGLGIVLLGVPAYRVLKSRGALIRRLPQGAES